MRRWQAPHLCSSQGNEIVSYCLKQIWRGSKDNESIARHYIDVALDKVLTLMQTEDLKRSKAAQKQFCGVLWSMCNKGQNSRLLEAGVCERLLSRDGIILLGIAYPPLHQVCYCKIFGCAFSLTLLVKILGIRPREAKEFASAFFNFGFFG